MVEHGLFDYLVCSPQERLRDGEAERLGGLEIDDELECRPLLDRKIPWLRSLQDLVHIDRDTTVVSGAAVTVSQQASGLHPVLEAEYRRKMPFRCEACNASGLTGGEGVLEHDHRGSVLARRLLELRLELVGISHPEGLKLEPECACSCFRLSVLVRLQWAADIPEDGDASKAWYEFL